jgi:hypothetical protein
MATTAAASAGTATAATTASATTSAATSATTSTARMGDGRDRSGQHHECSGECEMSFHGGDLIRISGQAIILRQSVACGQLPAIILRNLRKCLSGQSDNWMYPPAANHPFRQGGEA